jgi:pyruvate dehydrogenase E2 component (dihydrolipoamide acetyltransferase)
LCYYFIKMILRGASHVLIIATITLASLTPSVTGFGVKVSTFLPAKFSVITAKSSSSTALSMAAGVEITMPALSSTMKEGKVVSWLKSEGDSISAGEAIMVVESDKADMDVEAFEDGILAKIFVNAGEMAPVGQAVAVMASSTAEVDQVLANYAAGGATANSAPSHANGGKMDAAATAAAVNVMDHDAVQVVYMPALSSTMVEGKIVSWLVSVGDHVQPGDVIMVVESDKADMDVEAFEEGYLAEIMVDEGGMANVGAPVAIFVSTEQDLANYSQKATHHDPAAAAVSRSVLDTAPTTAAASSSSTAAITAPSVEYRQIDMPALSSTMKEGKVVSWLKSEGDAISAGEAIMVVESDKADMDVEAFEDGYLAAILTPEGESGAVGQPVALVAVEAGDIPALQAYAAQLKGAPSSAAVAAPAAAAPAASAPKAAAAAPKASSAAVAAANSDRAVASPLAKKKAEELGVDLFTVVGTGPEGRITAADVEEAAKGGAAPAKAAGSAAAPAKPAWVPAAGVIAATPTARALAKKAKLDLSKVKGTGQFGRVTADDVLIATGEKQPEKPIKKASSTAGVELPDGFVPFTGMQRGVSKNMVATLTTPIFRVSRDIEMDKFDALYQVWPIRMIIVQTSCSHKSLNLFFFLSRFVDFETQGCDCVGHVGQGRGTCH